MAPLLKGSYSSIQVSDARNGLRSAFSQLVAIAKQSKIEAFEPGMLARSLVNLLFCMKYFPKKMC